MKLKEYISRLQKIAKRHPDLEVVYASDDEGNRYELVHYSPVVGEFDGNTYSFRPDCDAEKGPNAVCIN